LWTNALLRKWAVDEAEITAEFGGIGTDKLYKTELLSPAQMEKVLKEYGLAIPAELLKTVSSGHTLVPESDKRPSVLGKIELKTALEQIRKKGVIDYNGYIGAVFFGFL